MCKTNLISSRIARPAQLWDVLWFLVSTIICFLLIHQSQSFPQIPRFKGAHSRTRHRQEFEPYKDRHKRLVGGEPLKTFHWPWLALVRMKMSLTSKLCSGTIINTRWVLTTASCIKPAEKKPGTITVKLGEIDLNSNSKRNFKAAMGRVFNRDDWKKFVYRGHKIFVHPKYKKKPRKFDVALIQLAGAVVLTSTVSRRINRGLFPSPSLVRQHWPPDGAACFVAGWGCTQKGSMTASRTLTEIHVSKLPLSSCGIDNPKIAEYKICAGNSTKPVGLCRGDPGSPMMCRSDDTWVIAGLVSFKSDEYYRSQPFTVISTNRHLQWISNTVEDN